jgi:hypothetical protein
VPLFRRLALVASTAAALTVVAPLAPVRADPSYCPYVVTASYASVFSRPSVHSLIYDAEPHGARIFGSSATVAGAGGPFRNVIAYYGSAYIKSDRLARAGGSCFSADAKIA